MVPKLETITYCVAIERQIVVPTCPLKKGECYWQHRVTKRCGYTSEELSSAEFCERLGLTLPSDEQIAALTSTIKKAVSA